MFLFVCVDRLLESLAVGKPPDMKLFLFSQVAEIVPETFPGGMADLVVLGFKALARLLALACEIKSLTR